jgi:hypothetical protein
MSTEQSNGFHCNISIHSFIQFTLVIFTPSITLSFPPSPYNSISTTISTTEFGEISGDHGNSNILILHLILDFTTDSEFPETFFQCSTQDSLAKSNEA